MWCHVRAGQWMFKTLPFKLLQQGCCWSGSVGSCHQVTFIFSALWRSILVVTDTKVIQKRKKLSHSGSAAKTRIPCWRHAFTHNALWQMPEPSGWQYGNTGYHSVFSWRKLLWTESCWISKYSLYVLMFQFTPTDCDRYKHLFFYGTWTIEKTPPPIIWYLSWL